MVGFVPADVVVGDDRKAGATCCLKETGKSPWPALSGQNHTGNSGYHATAAIRVHEFHYARLQKPRGRPGLRPKRVLRGAGIDGVHDGLLINQARWPVSRTTATLLANPWVERFVAVCPGTLRLKRLPDLSQRKICQRQLLTR